MPNGAGPYSKVGHVRARRIAIVEYLLGNPTEKAARELAKKFGVTERTIAFDLQSPEVDDLFSEYTRQLMKGHGVAMAVRNVMKRLKAGDPGISQWLLEKIGFFPKEGGPVDQYEAFMKRLAELVAETNDGSEPFQIGGLVEYTAEPPSGNGHDAN